MSQLSKLIKYKEVVDMSPHGVTIHDAKGRMVYANQMAADMCGFATPEDLRNADMSAFLKTLVMTDEEGAVIPPDNLPNRLVYKTLKPQSGIVKFKVLNEDDDRWTLLKAAPILDPKGALLQVVSTFYDITESKRVEHLLRILDETNRVLATSLSYKTRLMQTAQTVVPGVADWCAVDILNEKGVIERAAVAPTSRALHLARKKSTAEPPQTLTQVIRTGQSHSYTDIGEEHLTRWCLTDKEWEIKKSLDIQSALVVPLVARDRVLGTITFGFSHHKVPYKGLDKSALEYYANRIATKLDNSRLFQLSQKMIREQKEMYKTLKSNEQTLKLSLEVGKMGVWGWDIEKNIFEWSDSFQSLYGPTYTKLGKTLIQFLETVEPIDRKRVANALRKAIEKTGDYDIEFRIRWPDKSIHWIFLRGQVLYDHSRRAIHMVGIGMDITERKEAEGRGERLLSIVSHELRTPLANIKTYVEILKRYFKNSDSQNIHQYLARIDSKTDTVALLIRDLLDSTRIREGKLDFFYEMFNFNSFLQPILRDTQETSTTHRIIVKRTVDMNIVSDKARLGQVIENIVKNAIKYSPDAKEVHISSELKDKMITVSVQDFGIGIPSTDLKKIFNIFYQADKSTHHSSEGLGMGLYIASQIMKRLGGEINVSSKKGKGSTFSILIPVKPKRTSVKKNK